MYIVNISITSASDGHLLNDGKADFEVKSSAKFSWLLTHFANADKNLLLGC